MNGVITGTFVASFLTLLTGFAPSDSLSPSSTVVTALVRLDDVPAVDGLTGLGSTGARSTDFEFVRDGAAGARGALTDPLPHSRLVIVLGAWLVNMACILAYGRSLANANGRVRAVDKKVLTKSAAGIKVSNIH